MINKYFEADTFFDLKSELRVLVLDSDLQTVRQVEELESSLDVKHFGAMQWIRVRYGIPISFEFLCLVVLRWDEFSFYALLPEKLSCGQYFDCGRPLENFFLTYLRSNYKNTEGAA